MKFEIPRIMISSLSSGGGKTTVTCGILKALKNRGIDISSFKCGPDYIDIMFHKKALGGAPGNLDGFFCSESMLKNLFCGGASGKSAVIEGVMGYYDGISMESDFASSYYIAKVLKIPVIIVINAKGMALTAAPVIKGVIDFKKDSNIKGIILNNVSKGVYTALKNVIEENTGTEAIGYFPHNEEYFFESRHLGLVNPGNLENIDEKIEKLGKIAEECIDIDKIIRLSKSAPFIDTEIVLKKSSESRSEKIKIGVAYDKAFCFYYKDNIEILEKLGCEIVYFSPVGERKLPDKISGIILGGGYPELYLKELSENNEMLTDIKRNIEDGIPCLAECGGFIYLHARITDKENKAYKMAEVFSGKAFFTGRSEKFGYIEMTAREDGLLLKRGEKIKAHEFHYWDSDDGGNLFSAKKPSGKKSWECMKAYKNTIGGFPHIFYRSNINFAKNFVKKCREWKK